MIKERYCLNLSPRYVPNWGAWEVAREIICNALDADPEGFTVIPHGNDCLEVKTNTCPDIAEMFIIGEGSKAPGGATIGQFGEGMKMAALAATRKGSIEIQTEDQHVTFGFEEVMGREVLFAYTEPRVGDGFEVTLRMPGVGLAFAGRLLEDRADGPRDKVTANTRVYCKGVYVGEVQVASIWDWNLSKLEINRDRSMITDWTLAVAIGNYLKDHITPAMARAMIEKGKCIETCDAIRYEYSDNLAFHLAEAFREVHGKETVIATMDEDADKGAKRAGYKIVAVDSDALKTQLVRGGIQNSRAVAKEAYQFEHVDSGKYSDQILALRELDEIIGAPDFAVSVFAARKDDLLGFADIAERRVWLSESLFGPGDEVQLYGTYLHEVAHVMSESSDETLAFENAMTNIMGRLAYRKAVIA